MSDHDTLRQLHNSASRGKPLGPEELARLEEWYAKNDREESAELSAPSGPDDVVEIRRKLDEATSELSAASDRVRELMADNETIRGEIEDLSRQLARRTSPHPA